MGKIISKILRKSFTSYAILSSLVCLSISNTYSQDAEFTQFYASPIFLNPAFAGTHMCPRLTLNHRNQWPGVPATFITNAFTYDQHVDGLHGGLGLMVVNDRMANSLQNNRISGVYSYQMKLSRKFSVRLGFEATFWQKKLDWNQLTFGDMIDPIRGFVYQTGNLPRGGTKSGLDLSAGFLGFSEQFYFGFAAHHLTEPNESLLTNETSPLPRKLTGHMGFHIPLSGNGTVYRETETIISPNILYRMQGSSQQLNMGLYVQKGPYVGGIWYRDH